MASKRDENQHDQLVLIVVKNWLKIGTVSYNPYAK